MKVGSHSLIFHTKFHSTSHLSMTGPLATGEGLVRGLLFAAALGESCGRDGGVFCGEWSRVRTARMGDRCCRGPTAVWGTRGGETLALADGGMSEEVEGGVLMRSILLTPSEGLWMSWMKERNESHASHVRRVRLRSSEPKLVPILSHSPYRLHSTCHLPLRTRASIRKAALRRDLLLVLHFHTVLHHCQQDAAWLCSDMLISVCL